MTLQSARYHALVSSAFFFARRRRAELPGRIGREQMRPPGWSSEGRLFQWAQRPTAAASGRNWVTLRQAVSDLGSTGFNATIDVTEGEDVTRRGETRVDVPTLGTPCGMELPNSDRQNSPKARRSRTIAAMTAAVPGWHPQSEPRWRASGPRSGPAARARRTAQGQGSEAEEFKRCLARCADKKLRKNHQAASVGPQR